MEGKIRMAVEALFEEAPNTRKMFQAKEELIGNLIEKYKDLINEGDSPEEAYHKAITGIGNVDALISELRENPRETENKQLDKQRAALITSCSFTLYVISFIVLIGGKSLLGLDNKLTFISFLVLATIPTCLLIYQFIVQNPLEENGRMQSAAASIQKFDAKKRKEVRDTVHSIIWTGTVALYLIVSFSFDIWGISWILFIIAIVVQKIVDLVFSMNNMGE